MRADLGRLKALPNRPMKIVDSIVPALTLRVYAPGRAAFVVRFMRDGRAIHRTIGKWGEMSVRDARMMALDLVDAAEAAKREPEEDGKLTLGRLFTRYFDEHVAVATRPVTQDFVRRRWKRLEPWQHVPIAEITPDLCHTIQAEVRRQGTLRRGTDGTIGANKAIGVLKATLNYGVRLGLIEKNPAAMVRDFPARRRKVDVDRDKIAKFLKVVEHLRQFKFGGHDLECNLDALLVMLYAGTRKTSTLHARWCDIDLKKKTWVLRNTKNGEDYTVFLSKQLLAIFRRRKKSSKSEYVFPSKYTGRPMRNIDKTLARINEETGFEPVTAHIMKHWFVAATYASGISGINKRLAGHKDNEGAHSVYKHLLPDTLREGYQKTADWIDGG